MDSSELIKKATDILFSKYPVTAALGLLSGVIIYTVVQYLGEFFGDSIPPIVLQAPLMIYVLLSLLISIFITHIRQPKLSPEIIEAIEYIEMLEKKQDLNDAQLRLMYLQLYQKILDRVELNEEVQEKVDKG